MPDLKKLADQIGQLFKSRSQVQHRATLFVKVVLITFSAAIAGIAQSVDLARARGF
jgi:hypothetical protein